MIVFLLLPTVIALPPIYLKPSIPIVHVGGHVDPKPCKMSPLSKYLSEDQQIALHEVVTEARKQGAKESVVKEHMDKYLAQILSAERLSQLAKEHDEFEAYRRGKRNTEKQEPKKVFDVLDNYYGYQQFYEENTLNRQPRPSEQ